MSLLKRKIIVVCISIALFNSFSISFHQNSFADTEIPLQSHDIADTNIKSFNEINSIKSQTTIITTAFEGKGSIILKKLTLDDDFILKGENAKVTLNFESEKKLEDISLSILLESIPSEYGPSYIQDINRDGQEESLILEAYISDFLDNINSGDQIEKTFTIGPNQLENANNEHSMVPLNRGSWQIIEISFISGRKVSSYSLLEPITVNVLLNSNEHVVFTYFVHNDGFEFTNGLSIRDSIEESIFRLENQYSFSLKLIILTEDNGWDPEEGLYNASDMINDACNYVGGKLSLINGIFDYSADYDLKNGLWTETKACNGGYDIIIATSNRPSDVLGLAGIKGNWAYVGGGKYALLNFKISQNQYDNIIQHEISHIFGALDRDGSGSIMDTSLIFNGTHFTSPCLEAETYRKDDEALIENSSIRFDGISNPSEPLVMGKNFILADSSTAQWIEPIAAKSQNKSNPKIHYIVSLKNSKGKMSLYYSNYLNGKYNYLSLITNTAYNATNPSLIVDYLGNFHIAWVAHNVTSSKYSLFYKMRTNNGVWGNLEILRNDTFIRDCSITVDESGNVLVLYNDYNESGSFIHYQLKTNHTWGSPQLLSTEINSSLDPIAYTDEKDQSYLLWYEEDSILSKTILYLCYTTDLSEINYKEVVYIQKLGESFTNIQVHSYSNSKIAILWEKISRTSYSLHFLERLSDGTIITPLELYSTNSSFKSLNSNFILTSNNQVYVFWEKVNRFENQSSILYRTRSSSNEWSYINQYSNVYLQNSYPFQILSNDGELLLFSIMNQFTSSSTLYSRLYLSIIYPYSYQVTVENFSFSYQINNGTISIQFSNITAISSDSSIGKIDDITEALLYRFGIYKKNNGYPIKIGVLSLDAKGTWFGSCLLENLTIGEYFLVVAFIDNNNVYSDHWRSMNSIIIERSITETIPANEVLIISLIIASPIALSAIITPTIYCIKRRKLID